MNCEKCQSNYVYHVNTVKVCFECIEYDNRSLRNENAKLKEIISYLPKVPTQPYEKELVQRIQKLEAENALMKEAMEFVLGYDGDFMSTSAEIRLNTSKYVVEKALKELEEK